MKVEKNPLWLGEDMLNLSMDFTSQYLNDNAKHFDNHAVVFISDLCITEGDFIRQVTFGFVQATDEDNCMVVETFGAIIQNSALGRLATNKVCKK